MKTSETWRFCWLPRRGLIEVLSFALKSSPPATLWLWMMLGDPSIYSTSWHKTSMNFTLFKNSSGWMHDYPKKLNEHHFHVFPLRWAAVRSSVSEKWYVEALRLRYLRDMAMALTASDARCTSSPVWRTPRILSSDFIPGNNLPRSQRKRLWQMADPFLCLWCFSCIRKIMRHVCLLKVEERSATAVF